MASTGKTAAFFDVDRTLVWPHSMERLFIPFLIRRRYLRASDFARFLGYLAINLGSSSGEPLHANKRHFKNKDPKELDRLAEECFNMRIKPLVSPAGRQAVQEHHSKGHMVVLVTGSLKPLAEQIRRELNADLAVAASLEITDGTLSGTLANRRPYGPEKARLVRELAATHNLDLALSYAYGDHHSDVDLLRLVGNPRVVNPNLGLRNEARRNGWPILKF
jgi:putative phosphoserine phosphatase/1-acylglycerol-3-phosphate O-acyltransferase